MNLHSFLYRKPQNFGRCLFVLLNGTCRAFTDILLSTVLLAVIVGKLTVTDIEISEREGYVGVPYCGFFPLQKHKAAANELKWPVGEEPCAVSAAWLQVPKLLHAP